MKIDKDSKLIEEIAETIYLYEHGLHPEEFETFMGYPKARWRISSDKFIVSGAENISLVEHERQDYRLQAEKVIEFLRKKKLLNE